MHFFVNKISKHTIILVFIFIIQSSPSIVRASETHLNESDKQFSFAEALFAEGDYYRAITEYKRFSSFFPDNKLVEKSKYKIGVSYFRAKRWKESVDALTSFAEKYPQSTMSMEALYLKGMAQKNMKRWNDALATFKEIIRLKFNEYTDRAVYQTVIIHLQMEEWKKARESLLLISPNSPLSASVNTISSGLDNIDTIPQKSLTVAGTLAAILPGAGHLYTERPMDALVAFLLNGAFICAAVELFRHDNYVAGSVVSFFEVGWYTGNIYSSVNSAHKYNKRTKENIIMNLIENSSFSYIYDPKNSATNLMFSLQF
jgi:outer membrane protein assembly factor BamD (BamD/ComL family)